MNKKVKSPSPNYQDGMSKNESPSPNRQDGAIKNESPSPNHHQSNITQKDIDERWKMVDEYEKKLHKKEKELDNLINEYSNKSKKLTIFNNKIIMENMISFAMHMKTAEKFHTYSNEEDTDYEELMFYKTEYNEWIKLIKYKII